MAYNTVKYIIMLSKNIHKHSHFNLIYMLVEKKKLYFIIFLKIKYATQNRYS